MGRSTKPETGAPEKKDRWQGDIAVSGKENWVKKIAGFH